MTARCDVYAREQAEPATEEEKDIRNAKFWDSLANTLQLTLEQLRTHIRDREIDPDDLNLEQAQAIIEQRRRAAKDHPCVRLATEYLRACHQWLANNEQRLERYELELQAASRLELPNTDPQKQAASVADAIEIVTWYHTLIPVKLRRAAESAEEALASDEEYAHFEADGSAKIALVAIDRSLPAWQILLEHLSEEEDQILPLLAQLDRLRRQTQTKFPNARVFKRPGFDD